MSAAIDFLRSRGVTAKVQGFRVAVSPRSNVTPEVRAFVKKHRLSLIAELAANDGAERRTCWRVVVDGRGITMLGEPSSFDEALAAARWRWPDAGVDL